MVQHYNFKNLIHSILLLLGMLSLLVLTGWLIGGLTGIIWALGFSFIFLLSIPTVSTRLTLYLYRARPLDSEQINQIIDWLAQRAKLNRSPELFYIPSVALLGFSTGLKNETAIALSDGMLRQLNLRELTAVLAHEMSHIKNKDLWVMVVADILSRVTSIMALTGYLMLILYLPILLLKLQPVPWTLFIVLIAAPSISSLMQLALSRTREFSADSDAIHLTGDPAGLISALYKIDQFEKHWLQKLFMPGFRSPHPSLLRTHPLTEERIKRLQQMAQQDMHPFNNDFLSEHSKSSRREVKHHISGLWH